MSFKEVREPRRKSSSVAEQIIDAINGMEYEVGDRLPSERKIAEQMGVSRNSVREALSALQVIEVVETRAGSGTYVKNLPHEVNIKNALDMAQAGEDLLEVWEARREVEIALVKLAWMRAENELLTELRAVLADLETAAEKNDYSTYIETNARFHLKIADFADNSYLKEALEALLKVPKENLLKNMVTDYKSYMKQSVKSHEEITEVIAEGPKTKIDQVVTSHFKELEDYLKEKIIRNKSRE